MLIILSDLHFSDETTASNVEKEVFSEIMFPEIRARVSSQDKNVEEINIILLGDIFDIVRTDKWLKIDKDKRPWNGALHPLYGVNTDPDVEKAYNTILTDILKNESCQAFILEIVKLSAAIPDIPVKVTYVLGNHDRAINNYDSLQNRIKSLIPGIEIVICNYFLSPEYSLLCRHGNEWDDTCYGYKFARKVLDIHFRCRFHPEYYKVQNIGEVVNKYIFKNTYKKYTFKKRRDSNP
jgi:UDP-2,3-diacylglucosamine pyrophosphatase LpxH